jgi:hypothetical protein
MRQIDLLEDYYLFNEKLDGTKVSEKDSTWTKLTQYDFKDAYKLYCIKCKKKHKKPKSYKAFIATHVAVGVPVGVAAGLGIAGTMDKIESNHIKKTKVKNLDMNTLNKMVHKKLGK